MASVLEYFKKIREKIRGRRRKNIRSAIKASKKEEKEIKKIAKKRKEEGKQTKLSEYKLLKAKKKKLYTQIKRLKSQLKRLTKGTDRYKRVATEHNRKVDQYNSTKKKLDMFVPFIHKTKQFTYNYKIRAQRFTEIHISLSMPDKLYKKNKAIFDTLYDIMKEESPLITIEGKDEEGTFTKFEGISTEPETYMKKGQIIYAFRYFDKGDRYSGERSRNTREDIGRVKSLKKLKIKARQFMI
ncbi:MAG: hypothetical protein U9R77_13305 [Pseudomonadota bacterium]|nr:hypothetical protein [Pseudomonadota bacterium]